MSKMTSFAKIIASIGTIAGSTYLIEQDEKRRKKAGLPSGKPFSQQTATQQLETIKQMEKHCPNGVSLIPNLGTPTITCKSISPISRIANKR